MIDLIVMGFGAIMVNIILFIVAQKKHFEGIEDKFNIARGYLGIIGITISGILNGGFI